MYHEMFPEQIIALQAEIQKHEPLLIALLQLPKDAGLELKLGEVAAYVEVILDGTYDQESIFKLCDILVRKLKQKRGEVVLEVVQSLPPSIH